MTFKISVANITIRNLDSTFMNKAVKRYLPKNNTTRTTVYTPTIFDYLLAYHTLGLSFRGNAQADSLNESIVVKIIDYNLVVSTE